MKNIILLLKKSSLYLVAMMSALGITYYLGMAPLLHAQADFPEVPDFPAAKVQAPASAPAQAAPVDAPANNELPTLPNDGVTPSAPVQAKPAIPAPPPRANISPSSGILFRHTKSYIGELSNPDRDPFRKPLYLLEREEQNLKPQKTQESANRIDDKIEAIRRWPLRDYRLVGVIWDVRNPKAMIVDPSSTMHLLKRNYRVGDKDGIISAISEGTITVIQDNIPVVITISSGK
jgi:Tfp pilus assembly protein PilP